MGGVLASVGVGMGLFLALHVVLWRANPSTSPRMGLLAWLAILGTAGSLLTHRLLGGLDVVELCAVAWIDLFVVIAYFFVYAGLSRSVSVTLLAQLARDGAGALDFEALLRAYLALAHFEDRLRLLHRSRLVRFSGDAVTLTPRGWALSRGARWLSRLTCGELRG